MVKFTQSGSDMNLDFQDLKSSLKSQWCYLQTGCPSIIQLTTLILNFSLSSGSCKSHFKGYRLALSKMTFFRRTYIAVIQYLPWGMWLIKTPAPFPHLPPILESQSSAQPSPLVPERTLFTMKTFVVLNCLVILACELIFFLGNIGNAFGQCLW